MNYTPYESLARERVTMGHLLPLLLFLPLLT